MDVKTCRKCGSLFNYITGPRLCQKCKDELEKKFQEVKKYIEDNKSATMPQICEAMDVEPEQVRQWVREERLIFAEGSGVLLNCENCGAPIRTGRYCDKCKKEVENGLNSLLKKPEQQKKKAVRDAARMRFLDN